MQFLVQLASSLSLTFSTEINFVAYLTPILIILRFGRQLYLRKCGHFDYKIYAIQ
jgi:hypothetical protein